MLENEHKSFRNLTDIRCNYFGQQLNFGALLFNSLNKMIEYLLFFVNENHNTNDTEFVTESTHKISMYKNLIFNLFYMYTRSRLL